MALLGKRANGREVLLSKKISSWIILGLISAPCLALALGGIWGIWSAASTIADLLRRASTDVLVVLIGSIATVFGGVLTIALTQYYARRKELIEIHKEKKMEMYFEFVDGIMDIMQKQALDGKQLEEGRMIEIAAKFQRRILLWASPGVINSWLKFRTIQESAKGVEMLLNVDQLYRAMRKDLGLSNRMLRKGSLIKSTLKDPTELDREMRARRPKTPGPG